MNRTRILAVATGVALALTAAVQAPVHAAPPAQPGAAADKHGGPPAHDTATVPPGRNQSRAVPPSAMVIRHYTGGYDDATNTGGFAGMKTRDNYRSPDSYHNLTELSVEQKVGDANTIEIGWGKGSWCSTSAICLFGYHWIAGVPQGYNVGFTDYAGSALNLGDALAAETAGCASGSAKNERFGIRKLTTGWGLWADLCYGDAGTGSAGQWLGEFAFTRWTSQGSAFTSADRVQVFNETASDYVPASSVDDGLPCDDQGGSLASPTSGTGMRLADIMLQDVPNGSVNVTPYNTSSGGYFDAEQAGNYEAYVLSGQPAGNARYINAGGLGFGSATGDTTGVLNC